MQTFIREHLHRCASVSWARHHNRRHNAQGWGGWAALHCPVTLAGTPYNIRLLVDKDFRNAKLSLKPTHGPPRLNCVFYDDGSQQSLIFDENLD